MMKASTFTAEALGGVDADAMVDRRVAYRLDPLVVAAFESAEAALRHGPKQVNLDQPDAEFGERRERGVVFRKGNAREVGAQKIGVGSVVGWRVEDRVDVASTASGE